MRVHQWPILYAILEIGLSLFDNSLYGHGYTPIHTDKKRKSRGIHQLPEDFNVRVALLINFQKPKVAWTRVLLNQYRRTKRTNQVLFSKIVQNGGQLFFHLQESHFNQSLRAFRERGVRVVGKSGCQ